MKFRVRKKGFNLATDAAVAVATTNGIKDYENAGRLTLFADQDGMTVFADNGLLQMKNDLSNDDFADLDYEYEEGGSVTVRAKEFQEVLSSFNDGDTIHMELFSDGDSGRDLRFISANDSEVYQSLSTLPDDIRFPQIVEDQLETVDSSFEIRRDIFGIAANRLAFARGFEDYRPEYQYWVIRANPDSLRFAAGSGGRFAILDYEGSGLSNATEDTDVLIPGPQSLILGKVISKISDERVRVIPLENHLVVRTDNLVMSMPNYEPDIQWPDENKYLGRTSKYRMVTRLGDWPSIVKGILATRDDEFKQTNRFHVATFTIKSDSNEILAEASGGSMRARRKARISDLQGDLPSDHKIRLESAYVAEAFRSASEDDYAQWEFDDEGVLVLRFFASPDIGDPSDFAKVNEATGLKERYSMFIATHGEDN